MNIAVTASCSSLENDAKKWAEKLNLPYREQIQDEAYFLLLTPDYLGLQKNGASSHPLYVDFLSTEMTRRRKQATVRKELLARALGLKTHTQPTIVDATAGLARDSFILASLGFDVTLLERSPIIVALLEDGFQRAQSHPEVAAIISRLHLIQTDAIEWLKQAPAVELIYIDPMFPERKKSALVKKNMQLFQGLLHEDTDADTLLQTALTCATKRVVVKRPRLAEPISNLTPSFSLSGSSSRFDIYSRA